MNGEHAIDTATTGEQPVSGSDAGSNLPNVADGGEPGPISNGGSSQSDVVSDAANRDGNQDDSQAVSPGSSDSSGDQRPGTATPDGDRQPDGQRSTSSTADWIREKAQTMSILIDLLKANGATDADLVAMKPLLENKALATKLESELSEKAELKTKYDDVSGKVNGFESERNKAIAAAEDATKKESELRTWWDTQAAPKVEEYRKQLLTETEKRAGLEARMSRLREFGYELPEDGTQPSTGVPGIPSNVAVPGTGAAALPAAARTDLPDLSKYVTRDDLFTQADMVGSAIALAQDLAAEHSQLFGSSKPMNFATLRKKAADERQDIRQIWERDYGVGARRAEIQATEQASLAAARQAELDAVRREGYEKGLSEVSHPMTRAGESGTSRFGVAFTTRDQTAGKPWEQGASRSAERLQKVVSSLAKQGAA